MARRGRFFEKVLKTIADRDRSNNNEVQEAVSDGLIALARSPDIPPQVTALVEEFADDERVIGGIYARFAQRQQRAIGDGEILDRILEFINSGGLQDLLEFITSLISLVGGLGARTVDALSVTPVSPLQTTPQRNEPEIR